MKSNKIRDKIYELLKEDVHRTYIELAELAGVSAFTARYHVEVLIQMGILERAYGKSRSIRFVEDK